MNLLVRALKHSVEELGEGLGLPRPHVTYAPNRAGSLVVGLVLDKTDVELATLNTRPPPRGPDDEAVEAPPMLEVVKERLMEVARARGVPHAHTAHREKPDGGMVVALVLPENHPGQWTYK